MTPPASLYDIFHDPDHKQNIRAYCLADAPGENLDFDAMMQARIASVPAQAVTWDTYPQLADDDFLGVRGVIQFRPTLIPNPLEVKAIGLTYEDEESFTLWAIDWRLLDQPLTFSHPLQVITANILYTVVRWVE